MSFILKSVELKNIRAHEHFIFEPALKGITAISGENGAGKSTIVDSFAWCLYGTRPSGIKNRNLIREGVNPKNKPVSVKSVILVGGVEYCIERKIISISGTTECNVWGRKSEDEEFKQVAGPAVTHVEKFIRSELAMNEKGFLTSIFIQQKQVDQIVSATPRERGVVIEELTGISSVTHAITKMNESTRTLEKASAIYKVGNVEEAKERVEKQIEVYSELEKKEKQMLKKFKEKKENFVSTKENKLKQEKLVNERKTLERDISRYSDKIDFLRKQAEEDLAFLDSHEKEYRVTYKLDSKDLKSKVDEKQKEVYSITNKKSNLEREITILEDKIKKIELLKAKHGDCIEIEQEISKLNLEIQDKIKISDGLNSSRAMFASEIKHSKASHSHISGEEKSCPVCKAEIENAELLKSEIEEEIKSYEKSLEDANLKFKTVNEEINIARDLLSKNKDLFSMLEKEKSFVNEAEELKTLNSELKNKIEKSREKLVSLEKDYDEAIKIEAGKKALEAAKNRSLLASKLIEENSENKLACELKIKSLGSLSDEEYNILLQDLEKEKEELDISALLGREIVGRKDLEEERLEDYRKLLKEMEESMERFNELSEQIEISNSAANILTAFKADRIENTIPTLEFYASDFLSKFTGGRFTKLTVDKKFNTFVTTSEGSVRPVAQLSGGELSTASIALRLGIAMLLHSSEKNVLILDEVLVSMDEERSRQIMETIGSMTNSQVIFIAHNSDINSVADKTVLIKNSKEKANFK